MAHVASKLESANKGVIVQNASVNGNTTRQALERLSFDVTSHQPSAVYVQFGMNDANCWTTDFGQARVSPRGFLSNLVEISDKIMAARAATVFVATNHPSDKKTQSGHVDTAYNLNNEHYNQLIREAYDALRQKYASQIVLIDHEAWWKQQITSNKISLDVCLLGDGVHLSVAGHREYAKCAEPVIFSMLELVRR